MRAELQSLKREAQRVTELEKTSVGGKSELDEQSQQSVEELQLLQKLLADKTQDVRTLGLQDPGGGCRLLGVEERNLGRLDPGGWCTHRSCYFSQETLWTQFL